MSREILGLVFMLLQIPQVLKLEVEIFGSMKIFLKVISLAALWNEMD